MLIATAAAKKVAEPDLNWLVLATLASSAGTATICVSIFRGLWVRAQQRAPRTRVSAIKTGAETLKLLVPGSAPYLAVEAQMLAEARGLGFVPRGENARPEPIDESVAVFELKYRSWVDTAEKREVVTQVASKVAAVVSVVMALVGLSASFVPAAGAGTYTVAAISGVLTAAAGSFVVIMRYTRNVRDARDARDARNSRNACD